MGSQTLTVGRNFYSIIGALLGLLCDLEAPLVLILRRNLKKTNLTSNILEIHVSFSQKLFNKRSYDCKHITHNLTCNSL